MSRPEPERPDTRTHVVLFAAVFWAYVYFFQGGGWNQNARWDHIRSLVEQRTSRINAYADNTYDIAIVFDPEADDLDTVYSEYRLYLANGWLAHYPLPIYSIKPPALSWAAVPVYVPLYVGQRAVGIDPGGFWAANVNVHVLSAAVVGLPCALLGVWMLGALRRSTSLSARACLWIALCGSLGTLVWPYATGLYSHSVVAALLFRAWMAVEDWGPPSSARRRAVLAGALAGAAVAVEYTAAPIVLLLALRAVTRWHDRSPLAWGLVGMVPWALALGVYHTWLFGNPWTTAYAFQRPHLFPGLPTQLFHGPDPYVWLALLVLPHRGLLVTSPVLVLGLVGSVVCLAKRRNWVPVAVLVSYLLLMSCWSDWKGGSALGPRYLVPAVPFLVVAIAACWTRTVACAAVVLGTMSMAIVLVGTSVRVEVPDQQDMPPIRYVLDRFFVRNHLSTNPQHLGDMSGRPRPNQPAYWPRRFASYNIGELLGLRGRASLLPLVGGWMLLAGVGVVLRRRPQPPSP